MPVCAPASRSAFMQFALVHAFLSRYTFACLSKCRYSSVITCLPTCMSTCLYSSLVTCLSTCLSTCLYSSVVTYVSVSIVVTCLRICLYVYLVRPVSLSNHPCLPAIRCVLSHCLSAFIGCTFAYLRVGLSPRLSVCLHAYIITCLLAYQPISMAISDGYLAFLQS